MNGFALYWRFVAGSIRAQMQYRASFIVMSVGQFFVTAIEALALWALFDRFGLLNNWTMPQVAMFYGVVHLAWSVADVLSRGFDVFGSQYIRTGNFDRVLLRPRSTVLLLLGHEFALYRIGRIAQGAIVLGFAIVQMPEPMSIAQWLLLVATISAGACFFMGLVILGATIAFWTVESLEVMNTVTYGGVQAAQQPLSIYHRYLQRFFVFVVPLASVAYFPVLAVLNVPDPLGTEAWFQWLAPTIGVLFLLLSLSAWRLGIRHYSSTGS